MIKKWWSKAQMSLLIVVTMITGGFYIKTQLGKPLSLITDLPYVKGDKICFVGDTGTGNANQYLISEYITNELCREVRILGDIIYDYGIKDQYDPNLKLKFLDPYKTLLNDTPIYITLGNHDYLQSISAWLLVAQNKHYVKFPYYYYAEYRGDVCIVTLDSNVMTYLKMDYINKVISRKHHSHESAQKKWLVDEMKNLQGCKFSIALAHHPYLSSGKHGDARGRLKKFYEKYIVGHFDVILAGHDHNLSYENSVKGTHQFVSGGGGGNLRGPRRQPRNYFKKSFGYIVMEYQGNNQAKFIFKYIENKELQEGLVVNIKGRGLR